MNGATLAAPAAGSPLPGVLPATAPAGLRKPSAPGDSAQPADFAAFLALVSGAGLTPAAPAAVPVLATAPTAEGTQSVSAAELSESPPLLRTLVSGGGFSPPSGNSLPPGTPPTATGAARLDNGWSSSNGRAATIVAPSEPPSASSGIAPGDSLTPFLATATQAAALPARWTQALLGAQRDDTSGDYLATESNDSVLAGDALLAMANGARATPAPPTLALPTNPAQQPAFEQALGERLAWLVQEGRHDARIKLHPAELGSIDIRLSLDGDSTRISLASPHAAVRDALEQAVPRLRELLGSAGLDLSQVNVGTGDARSHGEFGRSTSPSPSGREHFARGDDAEVIARTLAIRLPQGLVDTFA